MRSQVRRIGTLSGMELLVDFFRELATDPLDLRQVLYARAHDALQAAEPHEQLLAAFGADPRNALQRRSGAPLGASRPVPGDGEAVRFIANPLDQMQPGVVGGKRHHALADPQLLEPGLSLRALGDAYERNVGEADLGERFSRRAHLSLAAVDENQVGRDALPAGYPAVAARQRLRESAVVVARPHAFDVVATVFAPAHVHAIVHHAGRHRGLAHGVAHIEAFDTLHGVGQAQRLAQRREPRFLSAVLGELRLQGLKRVLPGHLEPGAALGRWTRVNANAAFRVLSERGLELFDIQLLADDQRLRYRPLPVVLRDERREHFSCVALLRILRKEAAVPELPAAAHHHQVDAGEPVLHGDRDDIDIDVGAGVGVLALADLDEGLDLVAVDRRLLVAPRVGGLLHAGLEPLERGVAASLQVELSALHVFRVSGGGYVSHAGRGAAPDLVEKAGPRAVLEDRIFAGAQPKHPLQQLDALAHRARVRKRTEVVVGLVHRPAVKAETREFPAAHHQVGIGLVVAEQDIVARAERLDEIVLEDQRLRFGAGDRDLDRRDLRQHHGDARAVLRFLKIRRDALFQVARLADIERLPLPADHAVHARQTRQGGEQRPRVEGRRDRGAPALFGSERFASGSHLAPRRKVAISRTTASNIGTVSRFVCVL